MLEIFQKEKDAKNKGHALENQEVLAGFCDNIGLSPPSFTPWRAENHLDATRNQDLSTRARLCPRRSIRTGRFLIKGENKDIKFFIEERELVAVESKEIYKFHLGPGDKNLSLQIDKDLLIHIQGGEVRVVDLREKFRIPLADARQGENLAQQICIDQEIHIPGEPMNEELKEQPRCLLGSGPSKSKINRDQEIHIPAGGSGKSTDATPATRFYLPDASDDEMPSDGPMH